MALWIVIVIVVFLALAVGIAVLSRRRGLPVPPPIVEPEEDPDVRRARQQELNERGQELLERRVELDARRGTLLGHSDVYAKFEDLEDRLRSGEISEDEFEAEKIRLLGQG